jgi:uncharacterized protein YbjQ (UPF0145 family)
MPDGFVDGVLKSPDASRREAVDTAHKLQPNHVVTAPVIDHSGRHTGRMLTAATASRVWGTGLLQEASAALHDAVGGRAATIEAAMAKQLAGLQTDIRNLAAAKGASAVVAYAVQIGTFSDRLKILVASGTPVILSD